MKKNYAALFVSLLFFMSVSHHAFCQSFAGSEFYATLRSGDLTRIEQQLSLLDNSKPNDQAKQGALIMKKAGLLKTSSDKLKEFKKGRELLETSIAKEDKPEYHFLRLVIQENAPPALGYNKDQEKDAALLKSAFPTLDGELQKELMDYSKQSKHFKLAE